jgi:thioredoxin 2
MRAIGLPKEATMQLVCPKCLAKNRVPDDRLNEQPICGKCGHELMQAEPVVLNDESFAKFTQGSDLPVLVDFWAKWCGPCKMMGPQFAAAAKQLPQVRFAKVDTEAAPETSMRYRIRSIPTMALFKNGVEVARMSGALSAADIIRWVQTQNIPST